MTLVSPVATDSSANLANVGWLFSLAPSDGRVAEVLAGGIVDRLGSGDALLTVATLGLTSGLSLMQSSWLGALAAEAESAQMGNVPIRPTRLREQIARWTEAESIGSPARQPATVASTP